MNNSDFQALVKEKTTKEIAREAVQEEFTSRKRGRRRGNDDDYLSDSDQEENSNKKKDFKRQKRKQSEKQEKEEKEPSSSTQYRDRAKERREGKNLDYKEDETLLKNVASGSVFEEERTKEDIVQLSKYLGGDDAHTHLVKGLDIALAQHVKRQIKGDEADLDAIFLQAKQAQEEEKTITIARDRKEALEFLKQRQASSFTSELGKSVYGYLKETHFPSPIPQHLPVSGAGKALQRSSLVFSKYGHPHDLSRSWEIPAEHMRGKQDSEETISSSCTPLPHELIARVKLAFEERQKFKDSLEKQMREKEAASSEMGKSVTKPEDVEESDDEDIFDDLDEYVPTAPTARGSEQDTKIGSVFDGLGNEELDSVSKPLKAQPGGFLSQIRPKKNAGVSFSAYAGSYGEDEMDFDYGGMHDPDDESEDKREKKDKRDKYRTRKDNTNEQDEGVEHDT